MALSARLTRHGDLVTTFKSRSRAPNLALKPLLAQRRRVAGGNGWDFGDDQSMSGTVKGLPGPLVSKGSTGQRGSWTGS